MTYPLEPDENGVKIKPELMEPEKLYYCIQNEKILMFFKDDQQFLNCYEIEEKEIVEEAKQCKDNDEIGKIIENHISKQKSQTLK